MQRSWLYLEHSSQYVSSANFGTSSSGHWCLDQADLQFRRHSEAASQRSQALPAGFGPSAGAMHGAKSLSAEVNVLWRTTMESVAENPNVLDAESSVSGLSR